MLIGVPALLIARQPDLGTALLVTAAGLFVLFLAGLQWWRIGAALALAAAAAPVAWHFPDQGSRIRGQVTDQGSGLLS